NGVDGHRDDDVELGEEADPDERRHEHEEREGRDRVEQADGGEDRAAGPPVPPGEHAGGQREHEPEDDGDDAEPRVLERELGDEPGVGEEPVHQLAGPRTPAGRPSSSTAIRCPSSSTTRSRRRARSAPMKLATNSEAGAARIPTGVPSWACRPTFPRYTNRSPCRNASSAS